MMKNIRSVEGNLIAESGNYGIIISRFNHFITDRLLEGCLDTFERHGVMENQIELVRVPGTFEIPLVAKTWAASKRYDAIICLGAIIRGGTPHFDYIAAEVSKGIAAASMDAGVPVIFGVITCDTIEQAIERAGTKHGNKGSEAALAAIEMANLMPQLKS